MQRVGALLAFWGIGGKYWSEGLPFEQFTRHKDEFQRKFTGSPVLIATWDAGLEATAVGWEILKRGGSVLDAVEQGVWVSEANPAEMTVGLGGFPDRTGKVTLDASIMHGDGRCGSVCFLENIVHPVTVARLVMEKTPHVMLAGEGAYLFARQMGMDKENLLTAEGKKAWKEWLKSQEALPKINVENHDTIGLLALNEQGEMAGSCTTSGWAFKMRGRVGDSPIIGGGLFVDGEVGGAVATGLGEEVIRTAGSFLAVEMMRQGKNPQEASEEVIDRILARKANPDYQVAVLALSRGGEFGSSSIHPGFTYAVKHTNEHRIIEAPHRMGRG